MLRRTTAVVSIVFVMLVCAAHIAAQDTAAPIVLQGNEQAAAIGTTGVACLAAQPNNLLGVLSTSGARTVFDPLPEDYYLSAINRANRCTRRLEDARTAKRRGKLQKRCAVFARIALERQKISETCRYFPSPIPSPNQFIGEIKNVPSTQPSSTSSPNGTAAESPSASASSSPSKSPTSFGQASPAFPATATLTPAPTATAAPTSSVSATPTQAPTLTFGATFQPSLVFTPTGAPSPVVTPTVFPTAGTTAFSTATPGPSPLLVGP